MGFKPDLLRPTGFLQCFDIVGLVIWPEMTYYVSSGTLNPTHSVTQRWWFDASGNVSVLINVAALHRAGLVLGWVTICKYTILVFNPATRAVPPWVGITSTSDGRSLR